MDVKHFSFPSKFTLQLMIGTVSEFLKAAWVCLLLLPVRRNEILSLLSLSTTQWTPVCTHSWGVSERKRDQGMEKNSISHPRKLSSTHFFLIEENNLISTLDWQPQWSYLAWKPNSASLCRLNSMDCCCSQVRTPKSLGNEAVGTHTHLFWGKPKWKQ